jgi:hypothetical protein
VRELRRRWESRLPLPAAAEDKAPDLSACLVHQQLQMLNACIRWRLAAGTLHCGCRGDAAEQQELRQETQAKRMQVAEKIQWERGRRQQRQLGADAADDVQITEFQSLSSAELKCRCAVMGLDISDCIEKSELVALLVGVHEIARPQPAGMADEPAAFDDAEGSTAVRRGAAMRLEMTLLESQEAMWAPRV